MVGKGSYVYSFGNLLVTELGLRAKVLQKQPSPKIVTKGF